MIAAISARDTGKIDRLELVADTDSSCRHTPYEAFLNGFHGFCSVFVTAAFAYTGTELTGLAAAETINPKKEIPRASKQVVWRILIFYVRQHSAWPAIILICL